MNEDEKGHRVLLEAKAADDIEAMLAALTQGSEFIRINPSKLTSWIVRYFHANTFADAKNEIAKAHFNPRAYLMNVAAKATNEDEARTLLTDALAHLQASKKKRNKKEKSKNKEGHEQSTEDH